METLDFKNVPLEKSYSSTLHKTGIHYTIHKSVMKKEMRNYSNNIGNWDHPKKKMKKI